MAANLAGAIEQQGHVPAISGLELWLGIHVDGHQAVPGPREQRMDFIRHLFA